MNQKSINRFYKSLPIHNGILYRFLALILLLLPLPTYPLNQSDSISFIYNKALYLTSKGDLDKAINLYESLELIYLNANDDSSYLHCLLSKADIYSQKRDFNNSVVSIDTAFKLILKNNWKKELVYSDYLQIKGSYFLSSGIYDSAKLYLYSSIDTRIKNLRKKDSTFSYAYNKLGNSFLSKGIYDSAQYYYLEAIKLSLTKKDPENYEISSYYQNLGIAYALRGDYINAEEYFLKSLKIKQKYFSSNELALAKIYNNIGRFYSSISKFDSSYNYYSRAEEIYLNNYDIDNFNLAPIYWNKGTDFIHKGDYEKAINYLKKAYYIYSNNLEERDPTLLLILTDLGLAYERVGNYKEAIDYFEKGLNNPNNPSNVKILRNLANTYVLLNNNVKAEQYYLKSIDEALRFFGPNSYDLALCYSNYGNFLLTTYNNPKGLQHYLDGIIILKNIFSNKHRDIAQIYTNISLYHSSRGKYLLALEAVQNALIAQFTSFNSTDYRQNPEIYDQIPDLFTLSAFYQKSLTLLNLYRLNNESFEYLNSAFSNIDICFSIIDNLRDSYSDEESKLMFVNVASSAYTLGVEICYHLSLLCSENIYQSKAFEFTEKNKSVLLLLSMRGIEALESSGIPVIYQSKEKQLKDNILTYNSLIYNEKQNVQPNKSKIIFWENQIFQLKMKYDSLLTFLELDFPSYYRLKYDDSVVTVLNLQASLEDDQVILEYSKHDSLYYIFIISKYDFNVSKVSMSPEANSHLVSILKAFKGNGLMNLTPSEFQDFVESSYLLYQRFIEPISSYINKKRIIIIPDAELGYLSFDLLLTRPPSNEEMNFRTLPYLIKEHPISYSSSATLYYEALHKTGPRATKSLLAFAPKYDELSRTRSAPNDSLVKAVQTLLPIPGVEEEINNIARMFRGKKYHGMRATESVFKEKAEDYDILHLAMHTIIDDKNPMFSKLVFTPEEGQDDGYLNTYELFNLELKGSLAVLSACNTGSGKLEKGEGIISLARGFIYAGIPSIVMTLWEVEDYSSADLMTGFYDYLEKGFSKDVALQKAKIDYLQKADALKSHPYFWAGFVSIGDPEPLQSPRSRLILWLIPAIAFILLSIFFINRQVYSRKRKINP